METKDVIALILSGLAFLFSIYNFNVLRNHNRSMRAIASTAPEISILASINAARMKSEDVQLKIIEHLKGRKPTTLNADEKRQFESLVQMYESALEILLNSYELACRLYRDNRIDRKSFKGQYSAEIRMLFEGDLEYFKDRLLPMTSTYTSLQIVYKEWKEA
jgi:hypothetical protein